MKRLSLKQKVSIGILAFCVFSLAAMIDEKTLFGQDELVDCKLGSSSFTLKKKDCRGDYVRLGITADF